MLAILASLAAIGGNPPPGAIDAYRANLATLRVHADFIVEYHNGQHRGFIDQLEELRAGEPAPAGPNYEAEGSWEFDGNAEHYIIHLKNPKVSGDGRRSGPIESNEVLYDNSIVAYHVMDDTGPPLVVHPNNGKLQVSIVGPLAWNTFYRFDRELEFDPSFSTQQPKRSRAVRGGHLTEVEVYEKSSQGSRVRREITYDPQIGYLPRRYRKIAFRVDPSAAENSASVIEFYLIDAQATSAGGFVPTEWYQVTRSVADFAKKYPNYDETTKIDAASGRLAIIHFKTKNLSGLSGEPKLTRMEGIQQILAPGGAMSREKDYGPMTIGQLKSILGAKSRPSNAPRLPNIDAAEQRQFDPKPATHSWKYLGALALFVLAASFGLKIWRRRAFVVLILLSTPVYSGCGDRPVARLAASFSQSLTVYEPSSSYFKITPRGQE